MASISPIPIEPRVFRIRSAYDTSIHLSLPYALVDLTGIALPRMQTFAVQAPYQQGATVIDQILEPRTIQLMFNLAQIWGPAWPYADHGTRQNILQLVNPGLGALEFDLIMSNGDVYTLKDVWYEAGFEIGYSVRGQKTKQNMALRLRAHDPAWWGDYHTWTINANTHNDMALPAWSYMMPAENYGSWWSDVTMTLTGPMYNPKIYLAEWDAVAADYATVALIELAEPVGAGETVVITTAFGNRAAVDALGANVALDDATVFALFHLAYHPIRYLHDLQANANHYNNFIGPLISSGCTVASTLKVEYYDRWLGV